MSGSPPEKINDEEIEELLSGFAQIQPEPDSQYKRLSKREYQRTMKRYKDEQETARDTQNSPAILSPHEATESAVESEATQSPKESQRKDFDVSDDDRSLEQTVQSSQHDSNTINEDSSSSSSTDTDTNLIINEPTDDINIWLVRYKLDNDLSWNSI